MYGKSDAPLRIMPPRLPRMPPLPAGPIALGPAVAGTRMRYSCASRIQALIERPTTSRASSIDIGFDGGCLLRTPCRASSPIRLGFCTVCVNRFRVFLLVQRFSCKRTSSPPTLSNKPAYLRERARAHRSAATLAAEPFEPLVVRGSFERATGRSNAGSRLLCARARGRRRSRDFVCTGF
jgi:hypothetical protein